MLKPLGYYAVYKCDGQNIAFVLRRALKAVMSTPCTARVRLNSSRPKEYLSLDTLLVGLPAGDSVAKLAYRRHLVNMIT